jgi:hypothetical protein
MLRPGAGVYKEMYDAGKNALQPGADKHPTA